MFNFEVLGNTPLLRFATVSVSKQLFVSRSRLSDRPFFYAGQKPDSPIVMPISGTTFSLNNGHAAA